MLTNQNRLDFSGGAGALKKQALKQKVNRGAAGLGQYEKNNVDTQNTSIFLWLCPFKVSIIYTYILIVHQPEAFRLDHAF